MSNRKYDKYLETYEEDQRRRRLQRRLKICNLFTKRIDILLMAVALLMFLIFGVMLGSEWLQNRHSLQMVEEAKQMKEIVIVTNDKDSNEDVTTQQQSANKAKVEESYRKIFEKHEDMIGWLVIPDTNIDYPVMQTLEDEEYYLNRNFYGEDDKNGSLLLDTDSAIDSTSNNLIIHGHNMRSGAMFGSLDQYKDSEYGMAHSKIQFYTRDGQNREYEILAAFYSKVYMSTDDVFKYYQFFEAETEEEFDIFYNNIMKMRLYDTGCKAEFGDEFITLSTCSYHTTDGRFVVVGRRVQ